MSHASLLQETVSWMDTVDLALCLFIYEVCNDCQFEFASGMNNAYLKLGVGYKNYTNFECYEKESVCAACDDLVNVLYG